MDNVNCKNFNAKEVDLKKVLEDGYQSAIVSTLIPLSYEYTCRLIEAGFKKILIEKPGAINANELKDLKNKAEEAGVKMSINYHRNFDPRVAKLLVDIEGMASQGYKLDYVSVFSCDKALGP